jgi:hypothetical protein
MANQTISVNRNGDDAAISGLLDGDDYTINSGATLTLNSDSRWGQQAAVIGNITIDSNTGGTVRIDGRDVWWVPYVGGTGTVPALGTVGTLDVTRSGVNVAEFLGVFTALGVARAAPASAMPATGFIKLRRITATLANNDVLTFSNGATVTVNSTTGGQRGWLHIVGEEASTITVPRLGKFEVFGDWFELGIGNGTAGQTFQYYVADICPAIWVETGVGTNEYEIWLNAGATRWGQNNRVAQDARGKFFNCSTAGVITIAIRGSVNNGAVITNGARVRVPNIHVSNSNTTNFALNTISTTLGTRWDFTTTSAGDISIDKCNGNWYIILQQPYSASLTNVGSLDSIVVQECAQPVLMDNIGVGLFNTLDVAPINVSSCFAGTTISNSHLIKYEAEAADTGAVISDCSEILIENTKFVTFGDNTAATLTRGATNAWALTMTRVVNFTTNNIVLGGSGVSVVSCSDGVFNNTLYFDGVENRTTSTSNAVPAFDINSASNGIRINGFNNFANLANIHPRISISTVTNSYRVSIENIGSVTSPYNCGSSNATVNTFVFAGNGSDHLVRRCYTQNAATSLVSTVNSDIRVTMIDVRGDYADTLAIAALEFVGRGLSGVNTTTGQTSVYGTHFYDTFTSATTGRFVFIANEPTANTTSKLQIISGTPKFTSTGSVSLRSVGDEIIWEMDYFALGHTGFTATAPVITGTNVTFSSGSRWGNHDIYFQYDTGSGYNGTWLNLNATVLQTIGTVNPATGIKLKIRAVCAIANTSNLITYIRLESSSTASAQQNQYPLPGIPLEITGLVSGSEVRIYVGTDPLTAIELDGVESSNTTFSTTHNNAGEDGYIVIFSTGYVPIRIPITFSSSPVSIPIQQNIDRVFDNPA